MRVLRPALWVILFLLFHAPASAQSQEDLSALNAQVVELYGAGKYAEAIAVAKKALTLTERQLGPDHPKVGAALNSLAEVYKVQGSYADAEPLYKRLLAIDEKTVRQK